MVARGSSVEPMQQWPQRLVRWLRRADGVNRRALVLVALLATTVTGFADYKSGPGLSLLLGYAICVTASGFFVSHRLALATAVMSAAESAIVGATHPDATLAVSIVIVNNALRLVLFIALVQGATLLRDTVVHLDELAHVDEMTGLRNRRGFQNIAAHERLRAMRTERPYVVAMFDLDGLKAVNDRDGHHAGDALICSFAVALASGFRQSDCVARLGGDEFVALLPDTAPEDAEHLARRLVDRAAPVAFCTGIATSADPSATIDEMIAAADAALYRAKGQDDPVAVSRLPEPRGLGGPASGSHQAFDT